MPLTYLDESAQRILSNVRLQMACRWSSGIRKRKLGAMIAISPSVAGQAGATLAYAQGSSRPRCSKSKGESTSSCCPGFCPSYPSPPAEPVLGPAKPDPRDKRAVHFLGAIHPATAV